MQWYYSALVPWVHYVPVRGDLKDLDERLTWAMEHDQEAKEIAKRGRAFVLANLTYESAVKRRIPDGGSQRSHPTLQREHRARANPSFLIANSASVPCDGSSDISRGADFRRHLVSRRAFGDHIYELA